ncbi:MAG: DNA primase [Deltaproteobacteria bacterium]|nr:DNA primase [Deltaproteobacteria bacterium]
MIPEAVIEEIRSRVDSVQVIGRRVELRKSGSSFSASCPFHPDRTPSFHVFPDSKRFKCFGCGARGDVFEFLRRFEGKDFRTAVRDLAAEVGVVIPGTGQEGAGPAATSAADPGRAVLERACEAAAAHWTERLWSDAGAAARRYLAARGIQESTARQFRLGLAPREWHDLEEALVARGFSREDLLRAGLLRKSDKGEPPAHDRFRGRLIFPLAAGDRSVVGFAGRAVADREGSGEPKYLNSPETPIFRKGHLLFGLPEAQAGIRSARRAVLVEGYFDAVAVHQAGARDVVACGGTALTEHQIGLLQRAGCTDLVLLFDTDPPGLDAPAVAAPALLRSGLTVRVARLPGPASTDPAAHLHAAGPGSLPGVLDAAMPLTEWLIERAIAGRTRPTGIRGLSVEQKLLVVRDLRPFVAAARPGLPRALFEQRLARRLELYIVALRAELGRGDGREVQATRAGGAPWHA